MRAQDALERSLTRLPGSIAVLCCTRCLCPSGAPSDGSAPLFPLLSRFPCLGFLAPRAQLIGKGEEIEGLSTTLLRAFGFFSQC